VSHLSVLIFFKCFPGRFAAIAAANAICRNFRVSAAHGREFSVISWLLTGVDAIYSRSCAGLFAYSTKLDHMNDYKPRHQQEFQPSEYDKR
jgi:hypothetical protein